MCFSQLENGLRSGAMFYTLIIFKRLLLKIKKFTFNLSHAILKKKKKKFICFIADLTFTSHIR